MGRTKRVLVVSRVSLFPAEHGGAKNLRSIVKALTIEGVECRVLVKLHPPAPERVRFAGQLSVDLQEWHEGVRYIGVEAQDLARRAAREIETFDPDAFLLFDDGLEDAAELFEVGASSGRLVFAAQTIHCLPFGPYSLARSETVSKSIRRAKRVLAPSHFVREYIEAHNGGRPEVYFPEVFGAAPFPLLAHRDNEFVTMINPCAWKGSSIFTRLARARPDLKFAAVPTWGATEPLLRELRSLSNVTLLAETPKIDEIFERTRILLAPSLCFEAFGLVSPEALLRGIPVVASNLGGLRESTLGAAALVDVTPLSFDRALPPDGHPQLGWDEPANAIQPWSRAIDGILASEESYTRISSRGREAAETFVGHVARQSIVALLE